MKGNTYSPLSPFKESSALGLRKEARLPAHLPAISINKDDSTYTTIINLSSKGIGLLSAKPFQAGDKINVTFEYKGDNTMIPVQLLVEVIYCNQLNDEFYIGGILSKTPLEYTQFFQPKK